MATPRRDRLGPLLLLARTLPASSRPLTALCAAAVVAAPVVDLATTLAIGALVAATPAAVAAGTGTGEAGHLFAVAALLLGLIVAETSLALLRDAASGVLSRRVDRHVRLRVLAVAGEPAGIAHLEDPDIVDRLSLARSATSPITPGAAASGLVTVAANRLLLAGPVLLVARFDWWLLLALVPTQLWFGRTMRRHIMASVELMVSRTGMLRHAWYAADLALTPGAAKDLRVFGLAGWLRARYHGRWSGAIAEVWAQRGGSRRRLALPLLAATAAQGVALVVVVRAAADGRIGLGTTSALLTAVFQVSRFGDIQQGDVNLQKGLVALPALLEVEEAVARSGVRLGGARPSADLPARSIRFEGVGFTYPGTDATVYDGLDLEIPAGRSLAVVGSNGAGKTTLVKLLARLYEPTAGRITVDGTDLRELEPAGWQRRVAAVFQDFTRYELAAAENVGFGALHLAGDRDALRQAAADAGALDLVERLPGGWDTTLSRRFAGGTDLSGGEWQRVALARALLAVRGGAGVLVLDEPTAHLDVRAEAELYDRFLALTAGVTTIVISHRFSTVRRADRIVVVDGGRVVEDGTHDELVARGGTYARMFALQSARYAEGGDGVEAVDVA